MADGPKDNRPKQQPGAGTPQKKTTSQQVPIQRTATSDSLQISGFTSTPQPSGPISLKPKAPATTAPTAPPATAAAPAPAPSIAAATAAPPALKQMTQLQKSQMGSKFTDNTAERKRSSLLGVTASSAASSLVEESDDEGSYDGTEAAEGLTLRDVWKAVQAPVQSREGQRSVEKLQQVLHQFAIATNPRYADDAPGKPRGHIYLWDVSRAMGCEVPHFVGAKELTLAQTCDWVRHEGPMRGWKRTDEDDAWQLTQQGFLVVALPRDPRTKGIGIVVPDEPTDKPLLAGAMHVIGYAVHPKDLLQTRLIDYFHHA